MEKIEKKTLRLELISDSAKVPNRFYDQITKLFVIFSPAPIAFYLLFIKDTQGYS